MRDDEIDPLTGVWNRAGTLRMLDQVTKGATDERGRGSRTDRWSTVVMLDIDDMKVVNDEHGHAVGDAVIADVAQRLATCAGDQALVSRWGGDEFLVLSPHGTDECQGFFGLLVADLRGGEVGDLPTVSLSAGAAVLRADDVGESVRRADLAMFEAKAAGRDRLCVYDDGTDAFVEERRDLLDRLRRMHDEIVRLAELSRTDPLTQLGNRRALQRHVEIVERRRSSARTAALFIDLDRFGEYNRLRGDAAGDLALQLVSDELLRLCRYSDVVVRSVGRAAFRKGGEEFVVVAPVTDDEDARRLGERIRAGIEGLDLAHGAPGQPVLTATIGISVSGDGVGLPQALRESAVVTTRLKNDGRRNCVELVDPADRPAPHELPHETVDGSGADEQTG